MLEAESRNARSSGDNMVNVDVAHLNGTSSNYPAIKVSMVLL